MFETGAFPSQDGTCRVSDGEGLTDAPHEAPQGEHQLDPARRADLKAMQRLCEHIFTHLLSLIWTLMAR